MTNLAIKYPEGLEKFEQDFTTTFTLIAENGADEVFRRWNVKKGEFQGSFLLTAFEVFGCGFGYNVANGIPVRSDLIDLVKEFWSMPQMQTGYSTGRSTESRLAENLPIGREITAA